MRLIFICCVSILLLPSVVFAMHTAKITIKAVDEQAVAVEGAKIRVGFVIPASGGIGTNEIQKNGITDKNGEFTASSDSMNLLGFSVDKEGYYQSGSGYEFTSSSKLLNRWEPWNPTIEVVLKKKRNPVPMYRKYLEAENIPVLDSPVGYDLEKGDWVSPHGKGVINDLVFLCRNKYESFTSAETSCEINFSNPQDGMQEYFFDPTNQSLYKWPFAAPQKGYDIKKITKWMSVHLPEEQYKSNYKEDLNYLFRVRTVVDNDGKIVKANYGKIQGDIRAYKKAQVNFTYYYNPDGTRNLEEDPRQNLFDKK